MEKGHSSQAKNEGNRTRSKREFMETMQDPYEVQTVINNILNSANGEILLTLPTKTTTLGNERVYCYEQEYLIPLLRDAVARGVNLRFSLINLLIRAWTENC